VIPWILLERVVVFRGGVVVVGGGGRRGPVGFCGVGGWPVGFCGVAGWPVGFCGVGGWPVGFCGVAGWPIGGCPVRAPSGARRRTPFPGKVGVAAVIATVRISFTLWKNSWV
jgi:hypothetical protein